MPGVSQGNGIPIWFHPVTWILVVFGWVIVNWQNNRREDRKELRAALTKIYTDISELEKEGIEFHTARNQNYNLASKILLLQSKLSEHLTHLRIRRSSYFEQFTAFTDSITLENFHDANYSKQAISSTLVENIRFTAMELETALEAEFNSTFRGSIYTRIKSWLMHTKESTDWLGSLIYAIERNHQGIFTVIAYLGILGMIYYTLLLIPKH
ncbi:hypothetical protein [Pseudomonas putida]|uniref:hypothetical protein n=1 Tax=Pseudomonas putida TaxID=303 RepID=UPI00117B1402|nr:hypothetical protein [Pseudomonas putida]